MTIKYAKGYVNQEQDFKLQQSCLKAKKEKHERSVERINKKLESLERKRPFWIDGIIKLIAEDMIKYLPDRYYEILGPFGLGARTSIHFYRNELKDVSGTDKFIGGNCVSITFEPFELSKGTVRVVDYTRNLNLFSVGTIGELNGFNHPTVEIPEDVDAQWFIDWMNKQRERR